MIKKMEEMKKELREKMRGGNGTVEILHIINQDEFKGKIRLCAKVSLHPGCSIGLHQHKDEEELYYIIKGRALVVDDDIKKEVFVGDAILTGNGSSHSIENIGQETLEFVAVIVLY